MKTGPLATTGSPQSEANPAPGEPLDRLAALISVETDPARIRETLVALAKDLGRTDRVWIDAEPPTSPEAAPALPADDLEAVLGGELAIPMVCAGQQIGLLRLRLEQAIPDPTEVLGKLRGLASVAAACELAIRAAAETPVESEMPSDVCDAAFLSTFLRYALAQSHRRRESMSILAIEIDRMKGLEESLGDIQAEAAIKEVGLGAVGILRSSDLVARVGDRIVAVLPGASSKDAIGVAETLRSAIQRVCRPNERRPGLTVCVGVAAYPENALDAVNLLEAAYQALRYTQSRGLNSVGGVRPMFHVPTLSGVGA